MIAHSIFVRASALAAAALVLAVTSGAASARQCVRAGGEATMVTRDLAEFMAKAALKNSIADKGLKPVGEIKLSCGAPSPLTHCTAYRQACK